MNDKKLDRRRKYYFVLDCETATMPYAAKFQGEQRKVIAISKSFNIDAQIVGRIEEGERSLLIKSEYGEFEY